MAVSEQVPPRNNEMYLLVIIELVIRWDIVTHNFDFVHGPTSHAPYMYLTGQKNNAVSLSVVKINQLH